jgi:hydrogenase nickel incorporation protein HypB
MCATCGCGEHDHGHEHEHEHEHHHREQRTISVERDVLEKNNRLAERNRGFFEGRGVLALNLVASPGAGKTTLLERTLRELPLPSSVIEGDQATELDAARIRAAGARAVQVNTGTGCHLDAQMIAHALDELRPQSGSVLFIENVGNLVCPALFDLGEHAKVLVASVTEGEDKPLKYPHMFRGATLLLLNKIDLLPHLRYDVDRFEHLAREVNPRVQILRVSAISGEGLDAWYRWVTSASGAARPERSSSGTAH